MTSTLETVDQIIATVPISFRPALTSLLQTLATAGEKSSHAREAIRSFKQHKTAGTFPPALNSMQAPSIQCSKEFTATADHSTLSASLGETIKTGKNTILTQMISIKESELKFFIDDCTNLSKSAETFKRKVLTTQSEIQSSYGGAENVPHQLNNDFTNTTALAELLCSRAIQCGYAAHRKVIEKRMQKLSLKQSVDVTMSGDTLDKSSIEKIVNIALNKRNKDAKAQNRKRTSGMEHYALPVAHAFANQASSERRESTSETSNPQGYQTLASQTKRSKRRREIQEEIQELMDQRRPRFRVKDACSYPDSFLDSTEYARLCFVVFNTPVSWFETVRRSNPGVHKHPDVTLPFHIEYAIALNLKHIFHQKPNFSLPSAAFEELTRSIRIRWAMRDAKDDGTFIPKFHIRSDWDPPPAAPHIEEGIAAGKLELLSQVPFMTPDSTNLTTQIEDRMSIGPAYRYLIDHRLLCLITDKNLGIAVVPVNWYDTACRTHIEDGPYDFIKDHISITDIQSELSRIETTALLPQIRKFIASQPCPADLPTFYGIPKIHKSPWTLRPIVPTHAWLTANIGKVVDHLLQPIMRSSFPWILESTKQLVRAISTMRDKRLPDTVFITGDVSAMYTNISQQGIIEALKKTFETFNMDETFFSRKTEKFLLEAVTFINSHCFFQYRGLRFRQNEGIAMGSPCAPVLANIYLGWFEHENLCYLDHTLYGRYIDDIICLQQFPPSATPDVPGPMLKAISASKLNVTWQLDRQSCVFLDLTVYKSDETIQTQLFSKSLNHYQYIPWSSAHPISVKRAFCKAELLRFLVASSTPDTFAYARQTFWHHLHARGYPTSVLSSWFKIVTWLDRDTVLAKAPVERRAPLMLPGQYNPIWDHILVRRIKDAILQKWSTGHVPAQLQDRFITSLARTESLLDYSRNWNKRVLTLHYEDPHSPS